MKTLSRVVLAAMLGLCSVSAVNAAELKIGVVDVRELASNSPKAKAIGDKLKAEFQGKETKLMARGKIFEEKNAKLKRDGAILSAAEKSKLEKEIASLQRELQNEQAQLQEEAGNRQRDEMGKFLNDVKEAVNKVAKEGKYDLIIHSEALPYASDKVDITKQVAAQMK